MITISPVKEPEYQKIWQEKNKHVLQSLAWGNVKESEGWQILRAGIFQDDLLVDVLCLQIKNIGVIKFGYLPKINDIKHWSLLSEFCKQELHLDFVIVEFDIQRDAGLQLPPNFVPYQDHIQPPQTNLVNLHKTEEQLFACLKGNYRRNIKKAQKDNIICKFYLQGEDIAVDKLYFVLQHIFANTKFLPRTKKYFNKIWQELSATKEIVIGTAEMGQELLGAFLIVTDNKGAYELYGGVTKNGRNLEAGYLLKWEAIKYFNAQDKDFYDHWGVSKMTEDGIYEHDELFNISSFKEGFGGIYHEFYPTQVLLLAPQKYKIFKLLKAGSNIWTKLIKSLK